MLLQKLQEHLKNKFHLHPQQCTLILAVSGGIDSSILTDLLHKSNYDFIIAHCNFQLRGNESDRDENFVQSLGEKYSKEVLVKKFDTEAYAAQHTLSIQEAARNLRYAWFAEIVDRQSSTINNTMQILLVTAHNANDNIETMLMHFFRGTGIHGLTGIPEIDKERKIIRPLLFATREEIVKYARENKLQWVEDSSNTTDKYTRNFFRLNVLPAIKEVFPKAEENLLNNIERFKETELLFKQSIEQHRKKLQEQKGNEIHIPVLKLKKAEPLHTIVWEIIKPFDFTAAQTIEIIKLLDAENGSYVASATHRIIRNRNWIIIAPLQTISAANILIENSDGIIPFENGMLQLKRIKTGNLKPEAENYIATLDTSNIEFPLLLRKWKQGDYFYPLGMQKKKKLSRFFIDQKLSKTDKEKVWVIESNKKILWVIGHRIDDRFKITSKTKEILQIELRVND